MAYAVVQSTGAQGTTNATPVTMGASTTSGNTLIAICWTNFTSFAAVTSVTDNKSNTWTLRGSIASIGNGSMYMYTAQNITGGASHIITSNLSGSGQENGIYVREYSGLTTTPFDKYAGQNQNTTAPVSPSTAALSSQPALVLGAEAVSLTSAGLGVGSGFGNFTTFTGSSWVVGFEDKRVTSTAAVNSAFTQTSSWNSGVMVAAFSETGGGGPSIPKTLLTMGVGT